MGRVAQSFVPLSCAQNVRVLQQVKDVWRESCGFEAALAAISSLDAAFSTTTAQAPSTAAAHTPSSSSSSSVSPTEKSGHGTVTQQDRESTGGGGGGGGSVAPSPNSEATLCEAEYFRVIQAALFTLVASASAGPAAVVRGERLVGCRANRRYLRREISYHSLACCLVNSGVVASPTYAGPAVKLLFTMVTELPCDNMRFDVAEGGQSKAEDGSGGGAGGGGGGGVAGANDVGQDATVRNADAVMVILGVLPYLSEEIAWAAVGALNQVVRAGGFAEAEALVAAGVARKTADVLAKALHAQTTSGGQGRRGSIGGTGSRAETSRNVGVSDSAAAGEEGGDGGSGVASAAIVQSGRAFRRLSHEGASRGREHGLWEPLQLTERLRQRLVEFLIIVASRNMTQADLAPVIRSVTLPLVMDSRGHVAPPTVWPAGLARPPAGSDGEAFWLPGWGTFVPPSIGGELAASAVTTTAAPWPWLGVLAAMSARSEESTPFLRLGGSANTDMSSLCHEVSRAGWRFGGGGLSSTGSVSSSAAEDADGAGKLWRGQQKALVEAALEEGVRMVHVPGLEGSASAVSGDGGGGGALPEGSSWPGPSGYSFACWMRFNPPGGGGSDGDSRSEQELPENMRSWSEDAGRVAVAGAAVGAAAAAAAAGAGGGTGGRNSAEVAESEDVEASEEDAGVFAADGRSAAAAATGSADKSSPSAGAGSGATTSVAAAAAGSSNLEKRASVDSASGRRGDKDDDGPGPHLPGRQVRVLVCFIVCM